MHLIVGDDKLDYEFDTYSPTNSLLKTKLLINIVISDVLRGSRFMSLNLKYHFFASPILDAEHMRTPSNHIPRHIMKRHHFQDNIQNWHVY